VNEKELRERTKGFALRVIRLVGALPNTIAGRALGAQLVRSGTSVGANYRAACRGRSRAEFIAKSGTVEEEAGESAYWIELIALADLLEPKRVRKLHCEAEGLTAIMAASRLTASRSSHKQRPPANRKSQS